MIRKPGSDKGPGFSMFGAYVCELIEGYVKLRFTHADIEVYESEVEVYARYRGLARILLCLFTRLLMQKKEHIHSGVCSLPYCQPIILLVSWQCFFHYHLAAYIFCSIQFVDCLLGFSSFGHLYEGKTF